MIPPEPPPTLAGITHGLRLVAWLRGQSNLLWTDHWSGRLLLRLIRAAGRQPTSATPGPWVSNRRFGDPVQSWLIRPPGNFSVILNNYLHRSSVAEPETARLMKRFRKSRPAAIHSPVRVLLIDQRASTLGMDGVVSRHAARTFQRMIDAAYIAHPEADFRMARSSDIGSGRWLSSTIRAWPEVRETRDDVVTALDDVDHVYTLDASEGMFALLADVPVHVHGAPYYAGWGLTCDVQSFPGRTARPTLAALFKVIFLDWGRYLDPSTHLPGSLDNLLDSIELQRAVRYRFSDLKQMAGIRFQWWKRPFATPFLTAGHGALRWTNGNDGLYPHEHAVLWGARSTTALPENAPHVRIEDGFFHSCGLGSDISAPYSQVIDTRGLYFDATRPSDLSVLLNETEFSDDELVRAASLRHLVTRLGVTKYNLGRRAPAWVAPTGKTVVLVPGQVADDASIRLGTRAIRTSGALLREIRACRPDAFIVYKPHPDVLSGNRTGAFDARDWADVVDTAADILSLIEVADEVHTLSSLAGFDALLRGKAVFTYGLPFYGGWGLTHDALAPLPWRGRMLSLDMLTAGVLLRYPLYWDWRLRLFTTPEAVVRQLAGKAARPLARISGNPWRPLVKAARWLMNVAKHAIWLYRQQRADAASDKSYRR